jgi:hypothetical protein
MNVTVITSGRPEVLTTWLLTAAILSFLGCEMTIFFQRVHKNQKDVRQVQNPAPQ